MKHTKFLVVAVTVALASATAYAQTATIAPAAGNARMQLDTNKDGAIDRAEAAKAPKLAEKFDQLDTNKDGKLSADERMQMRGMRHRGGDRGGRGDAGGLRAADTDKDGRISRAEADAANAKAGERFAQMDVNKDGYLDRSDMQARMAQRRGECFAKADVDKNGQLSRAEFDKMHEACGPMRGGMQGGVAKRLPQNNPNPGPFPPKK
ncbi:EF-hand domain-containing protein [Thermomonas sp. HDW16]|uniref:EF-hand domain-containing protein n=1 Tax=Thermomonas sp. HDW16 TaxID=2714945 RepID=UPI00140A9FF3|nr:EF-hand domain-containing protein [Thermomonas sp. HDW16]QIL20092.1 calcium-binding protein [Thermomonas sp. HDW16]